MIIAATAMRMWMCVSGACGAVRCASASWLPPSAASMEVAASSRVGGVTTYRPIIIGRRSLWAGLLVAPRLRYEPRLEYEKCRGRARRRRVQGCGWWAFCVWCADVWCVVCGVLVRVCVVCGVGCVCVRVWCGAVCLPRIRFNRHRAVRQLEVRERCFERVSSLELRTSYA